MHEKLQKTLTICSLSSRVIVKKKLKYPLFINIAIPLKIQVEISK
ncbi:hypothetical protein AsAng_0035250 [Aureispira anguillae]|uniref:Uncharacterized protein n=1 Tax=Aureispira anguillae TaxID=2864201 RepID=A0A915YGM4_9BACT|nr:hypothetical protein AsAng_0035250 [Aureispira anguillae]